MRNYYNFVSFAIAMSVSLAIYGQSGGALIPVLTISPQHPTCHNGLNGALDLTITNGNAPFTYMWSTGATSQDISNLSAGSYSVTVTDAGGASASTLATLAAPSISLTFSQGLILCAGQRGSITAYVNGAGPSPTFLWNNGQTMPTAVQLLPATYTVTVSSGICTTTATSILAGPDPISSSIAIANTSCGFQNGSITQVVSGGAGNYRYRWNNGRTTRDLTNLGQGNYIVTITDDNGCTLTRNGLVAGSTALTVTIIPTPVACHGQSTGTLTCSTQGGVASEYRWSNGTVGFFFREGDFNAGIHSVTVTSSNGCTATAQAVVTQPSSPISVTATSVAAACGSSNGSANVVATGGTPGYRYLWPNGATTSNVTGLSGGNYTITVTDVNLCAITTTVNVSTGSALAVGLTPVNGSCGQSTGSIACNVFGSSGQPAFLWNDQVTTRNRSGLASGTYTVSVSDQLGCIAVVAATINNGMALSLNTSNFRPNCHPNSGISNNGRATVSAFSGTAPVTYRWSNGSTTTNVTGLAAGTYTVTATDGGGCTTTATSVITQPLPVGVSVTSNLGSATVTASGGNGNFNYRWNTGSISTVLVGLNTGTYTVTATDGNGCTGTSLLNIQLPTGTDEQVLALGQITVFPNPAQSGEARMSFELLEAQKSTLEVYDIHGRTIATLFRDEWLAAGPQTYLLPDLATGLYLVTLTTQVGRAVVSLVVE